MPSNNPLILNLRITPHRSMNKTGVRVLFLIIAALFIPVAVMFFVMGAWPVMPFMGAEIALLALAMFLNFKRARISENIRLTRDLCTLERVDNTRRSRRHGYWRFEPRGLAVRLDEKPDGNNELTLTQMHRRVGLARFISPHERIALAKILREGLRRV